MKILIATDCYRFNTGGITASVLALCAGLRRRGHEVRTLSLSDRHKSFRDGDDFTIKSFPAFYYPGMRVSFAKRDPLIRELEEWSPDLIHIQTEGSARRFALRIGKRCGAPLVMTCHTDYGHFLFGRYKSLAPVKGALRLAGKILYRRADRVTAPSRKAAAFPFLDSARERLTVVPNGMETEKYQKRFSPEERRAFRASLGIGERAGVLAVVSRLSREKNVGELISFLPALLKKEPDAVLLVAGDGPYRKKLEKQTKKAGLGAHVVFTGRIPPDEVWRCYAAGDLFVSASTFEVHSMSYLEALAGGLPMLCRADDALEGVLDDRNNGFVYHDEAEFVDFAVRILKDPAMREEMGRNSARKAQDFSCDAFADAMLAVYESALAGRIGEKRADIRRER